MHVDENVTIDVVLVHCRSVQKNNNSGDVACPCCVVVVVDVVSKLRVGFVGNNILFFFVLGGGIKYRVVG